MLYHKRITLSQINPPHPLYLFLTTHGINMKSISIYDANKSVCKSNKLYHLVVNLQIVDKRVSC